MAAVTKREIGIVVFIIGVIVSLVGAVSLLKTGIFYMTAQHAQADVISLHKADYLGDVVVEFTPVNGGVIQVSVVDPSWLDTAYGQKVPVVYETGRPAAAVRDYPPLLFAMGGAILLVGLLLLGAGKLLSPYVGSDILALVQLKKQPVRPPPQEARRSGTMAKPGAIPGQGQPQITHKSNEASAAKLASELQRDPNLFGLLKPLVEDTAITDIIVTNYDHITVRRRGRMERWKHKFESQAALEGLVERLLLAAGTGYSISKPIADGNIGQYIRIHVVHAELCEGGPYLTIRCARFSNIRDDDLLKNGTVSEDVLKHLREVVSGRHTILIVGEVGTGKTTILRALASLVGGSESILVIEDTREIKIEHSHVRYLRTREANIEGYGKIEPSDCIRASMRMSMDRVIFGEIRDPEAAEAFVDVCSSGHPGFSTFHARSVNDAVYRLRLLISRKQPGVSSDAMTAEIANAVHVIVQMGLCRVTDRLRVMEVGELATTPDGELLQQLVFKYEVENKEPHWRRLADRSLFASASH